MSQLILSKIGLNKSIPTILARLVTCQQSGNHFSSSTHIFLNQTNTTINQQWSSKRTIFSENSLGLSKLEYLKESRAKLYNDGVDRYIERLASFLEQNEAKSICKDDLINLIAFAEEPKHLDMIEQIAALNKDDQQAMGSWGSAVMRVYYKLKQLDRAYENLKNFDKFGDFFNQRTSYQILMSMLFQAGRYQDVLEIYELSTNNLKALDITQRYTTDRRLTVLVFSACCKINTPEAFEMATKLYAKDVNNPNLKARTVSFLAYLAVKQNQSVAALNLLTEHPNKNYITAREIKTIALTNLNRYEDVLYHLKDCLSSTRRDVKIILEETYNMLLAASNEISDEQLKDDLVRTLNELKQEQLVGEATLDSVIFKEIDRKSRDALIDDSSVAHESYQNRRYDGSYNNRQQGYGNDPNAFNRGYRQQSGNYQRNQRYEGQQMQPRRNWQNNDRMYNDNNDSYKNNRMGRRPPPKSYFEDDLDDDIEEEMSGREKDNKRYR